MAKQKCPKCGKIYKSTRQYTNGDVLYVHKQEKGLLGFTELNGCYVSERKANKEATR